MARTQGQGNPDWTRDETILALSLYFECGEDLPSKSDARVQELSKILRELPYHVNTSKRANFRNPDGVSFKLQNLRSVATGKGFGNTSRIDREVWAEFGLESQRVRDLALLIRMAVDSKESANKVSPEEVVDEFFEGRVLTEMHRRRERHPGVRKALLQSRQKIGALSCDFCFAGPVSNDPALVDAQFEAHHLVPIALAIARKTYLRDMALLCANCHRLVHRLISRHKRWLSLSECRLMLRERIESTNAL